MNVLNLICSFDNLQLATLLKCSVSTTFLKKVTNKNIKTDGLTNTSYRDSNIGTVVENWEGISPQLFSIGKSYLVFKTGSQVRLKPLAHIHESRASGSMDGLMILWMLRGDGPGRSGPWWTLS